MQFGERDVLDLMLVAVLAIVAWIRTTDFSKPLGLFKQFLAYIAGLSITIYLVFVAIFGIIFVAYIAVYLPKKSSESVSR